MQNVDIATITARAPANFNITVLPEITLTANFGEKLVTCTVLTISASRLMAASVITLKTFKRYSNDGLL
jgi:hypothetical protein